MLDENVPDPFFRAGLRQKIAASESANPTR